MPKPTAPKLRAEHLEPRIALTVTPAELAAIGVDQETIDLVSGDSGAFVGDIGPNNPGSANIDFAPLFLNEPTLRNTVDAIAASETVPAGATVLTTAQQVLTQITAGTVGSPNVYHILGDITLAPNETILLPSNVEIYVEGSIFKAGQFTAPVPISNDFENNVDSIFEINGDDNIRLVGIDNALLHSTPSFNTNDPHTSGVIIEQQADNITFEGFETRFLWNAVNARFGTSNVVVRDNLIRDSINRSVWFLGTSNSVTHHNFISNAGADTLDYDAFTADSVAFENVLIGAGRFTYFVEEAANNNFSVRQLSVIHRFSQTSANPNGFQLGNASNGTSNSIFNNSDGVNRTRDNFFLDNATYAPATQQFRGDFIATGDNGAAGNTYFYGNRGFSAGNGGETLTFGRNVSFRAIYEDRLPAGEILAARDFFFDSETGFNSYNLVDTLNGFIDEYGSSTPIRSEILPEPAVPLIVHQESGGQVVLEAEDYSRQVVGSTGLFFGLQLDDDIGGQQTSSGDSAVGGRGVVVQRNTTTNLGNSLTGPRLDYEIDFATPGVYNVHVRTVARVRTASPASNQLIEQQVDNTDPSSNNSVHVGFNGTAISTGAGTGVGTLSSGWVFVNDVAGGAQNLTINVTEPGRHTFNIWAREDGTQVDRVVLTTSATTPTGFGPAASATLTVSPVVGDYDLDLDVDLDDYQTWLSNLGSSSSPWADGNGNGQVDLADYTVWRDALSAFNAATAAAEAEAAEQTELAQSPASEAPSAPVIESVDGAFALLAPSVAGQQASGSDPSASVSAEETPNDSLLLLLAASRQADDAAEPAGDPLEQPEDEAPSETLEAFAQLA